MPKKSKVRQVNSLAYCAQAVQEEAQAMARGGALRKNEPVKAPFTAGRIEGDSLRQMRHSLRQNTSISRNRGKSRENRGRSGDALRRFGTTRTAADCARRKDVGDRQDHAIRRSFIRERDGNWTRHSAPIGENDCRSTLDVGKAVSGRALLEKAGLPRLSLFYLA